jgi:LmbE family N-acetylglucosaminyl deacetylase
MSSSARRIKDAVWMMFEAVWRAGFEIASRLSRRTVERWSSTGGQRVWVIAPHPDDEAIGCASAMLLHRYRGDEVCVVYVTDGRRSQALGLGADTMAQLRQEEARKCAVLLGVVRYERLRLHEGDWQPEQLKGYLALLSNQFPPDIIYAPSRIDFHPEHFKVAHVLGTFLSEAQIQPLMRIYQIHVPLTSILVNLILDTIRVRRQAASARMAYLSQIDSVARSRRMRRYARAYYRTYDEVEEFWQMSVKQYHILHSDNPQRWSSDKFRGIRYRSIDDPLAYWRGRSERRRLAKEFCRGDV